MSLNDKEKIKVLSLFAGIGGIDLGLESTGRFETVQFVEYERFCQHILRRHWPDVPIWGDVKTFDPDSCGDIDLICGGYPCQPFSVAGKQKGAEDDRHLWPRMFEIIKHKRPTWVLCENVSGHVNLGLDQVLFDLESEGYSWQTIVLGAVAVDAPHRRQRLFIVGYSNNNESSTSGNISIVQGEQNEQTKKKQQFARTSGYGHSTDVANTDSRSGGRRRTKQSSGENQDGRLHTTQEKQAKHDIRSETVGCDTIRGETEDVPNTNVEGLEGQRIDKEQPGGKEHGERSIERRLGGMVDGVPTWMDEPNIPRVTTNQVGRTQRLKALGNAVVPQVVAQIARAIIIEQDR